MGWRQQIWGLAQSILTPDNQIKVVNQYVDDGARDAFGNWRVTSPTSLFDTQFQYSTFDNITWNKSGNGTLTHLPNESGIQLAVGSDAGDSLIWQSKKYIRYQPGKSQKVMMTTVFGAQKANNSKRMGYYDGNNGVFFEQNGDNINMVLRSKVTGSIVENRVPQSSWNVDKMDGTGPSRIMLDSTKAQILFIDLEWLSVGRVRMGFVIDGVLRYVHYFNHANIISGPYMTTANLPIRYEILNVGDTASPTSFRAICCSVQSEGGFVEEGYFPGTANNGIVAIPVTTRRPILTIRPKAMFKGQVNRGDINPLDNVITTAGNSALIELVVGGVISGGANAWTSAGEDSLVEYNIDHNVITGGRVAESTYVLAGSGSTRGAVRGDLSSKLPLTLDIDGNNATNFSVVASSLAGTANVLSAINWREIY